MITAHSSTHSIDSWLTFPKANPKADLRLFCFPYAGGSSMIFRPWATKLPTEIELCPIELPGRGRNMGRSPWRRLGPIVEELSQQIQPYLEKPFAFFGHSMGGLFSFELARTIYKKYGISPAHLFVSARPAPQLLQKKPPLHTLNEFDFIEKLRDYGGTPTAVLENQELMQLFLPVLRADFEVLETYTYHHAPPLNCPITVFGGSQDHRVTVNALDAWAEQTKKSFALKIFPGDHFFINNTYSLLLDSIVYALIENNERGRLLLTGQF